MISPELHFEGFDSRSWTNLISLFLPDQEVPEGVSRENVGSVLAVEAPDGKIIAAAHSRRGRVPELLGRNTSELSLEEMAFIAGAWRVVVVREGLMDELAERLALSCDLRDNYLAQCLGLLRVIREKLDSEQLRMWPNPLGSVPVPSAYATEKAMDLILPDERAAVMVLFDEGVWTAVALRRSMGAVDFIAGPDLIKRWSGPLGGDWRRDQRVIVNAVSRAMAPVHIGIFADAKVLHALLREKDPGRFAKAVAVRDIVVSPRPSYLWAALGADAARGVGSLSARVLGGFDFAEGVLPIARELRARFLEATTVSEALGFDPMALLGAVLRREDGDQK